MFIDFFYLLRANQVKVTLNEWLLLMKALEKGLGNQSMSEFYYLCRSICVKHENLYDPFDLCFAHYFKGTQMPDGVTDNLLEWLEHAKLPPDLDAAAMAKIEAMDMEELRKMFEERLAEQKERHDGGNRWVGTGGTSPFGNNGFHPSGIRVGGRSRNKSAIQIATKRKFQNLRHDVVLDTRQISLALKKLRTLTKTGISEDLDLEQTINQTAQNAGDIELVFKPKKENQLRILLLMDVGGSMTAYSKICETLFSAAHGAQHFKEFKHYYFHNCVYELLYENITQEKAVSTTEVLRKVDDNWVLLIVGDAAMSPWELTAPGGSIDYWHHNEDPGIVWLDRLRKKVPNAVWLNPEPQKWWEIPSNHIVRKVFSDMYPLTMGGLDEAIERIRSHHKFIP